MNSAEDLNALLDAPVEPKFYGRLSPGLRGMLDDHWMTTLFMSIKKRTDREIHFHEILMNGDPIKIAQAVTAVRRAKKEAKDIFDRSTQSLWRLEIPKDEEQRRHFPAAVLSRGDICARTTRGPSLFYAGIRTEELQLVMYDLLEQRLYEVITEESKPGHQKLDIDAVNPIGCSREIETTVIRFDLQLNNGIAHAYPVTRAESDLTLKDDSEGWCSSDILQGYSRLK